MITEEWITNLEDRIVETTQSKPKKKLLLNEKTSRDLQGNIKHTNILIIRGQERET